LSSGENHDLSDLNTHWTFSPYPLYGSTGPSVEKIEKQSVDDFRLLFLRKMAAAGKVVVTIASLDM
jgi:hypothetical protein